MSRRTKDGKQQCEKLGVTAGETAFIRMAIDPLRFRGGKQTGPVSVASRMILKESEDG
jgi:hypothetical protein